MFVEIYGAGFADREPLRIAMTRGIDCGFAGCFVDRDGFTKVGGLVLSLLAEIESITSGQEQGFAVQPDHTPTVV